MKLFNLFIILIIFVVCISADINSTTFTISSFVDSTGKIYETVNISIPVKAIIFKKDNEYFTGSVLIEYYFLDKKSEPVFNAFIDTSFYIDNYNETQSNNVFQIKKTFPIDSNINSIKIILMDKMSSNSVNFETKLFIPYYSENTFIKSLNDLKNNSWHFNNDTISFAINFSNPKSSNNEYMKIIIKNIKVLYRKKIKRVNDISDTVYIIKNLQPGKYQLIVEYYKNNKKTNIISNDFYIDFSFEFSNKSYFDIINALSYIAVRKEINILKNAKPKEREKLWNDFWKRAEKEPNLSGYISYYDFLNRYQFVNNSFGIYNKKGYQTDMGRIYIIYGKPDEIEKYTFEIDTKPYIIWYYYSQNYKFIFVDEHGYGEYNLKNYYEQMR